jgi:membrane protein DedA with SNARE-associated domain
MPTVPDAGLAAQCLALFGLTIAYENAALIAAAYLIVEHQAPSIPIAMSVITGFIVGDSLIYGLGAAAGRVPLVRRWIGGDKMIHPRRWLEKHLVALVVVARVFPGPGVLFPTFVAAGAVGVPFWRFARITALASVIYVPLVLLIIVTFGATIVTRLGWAAWVALILMLLIVGAGPWTQKWSRWQLAFLDRIQLDASRVPWLDRITHRGMPGLSNLRAHASVAEHIPPILFYIPMVLQWLGLAIQYRSLTLPTVANPLIKAGGTFGESKLSCLDQVQGEQRKWLAPYAALFRSQERTPTEELATALARMTKADLAFPVVAKPDIGWHGYGVRLVPDPDSLRAYIEAFPVGETIILQQNIPYDGEAGVFYVRLPGEAKGRVSSLTLRYFPYVVGDGCSPVRELIRREPRADWKAKLHLGERKDHRGFASERPDYVPAAGEVVRLSFIGSIRVGGLYRDGRMYITPDLERRFDEIARSMPEFFFGRFDVRFKSIEQLQQGEDFAIIEINGAGSEIIHVWDPNTKFAEVYRTLFTYQKTLFKIGADNRSRGFKPISLTEFFRCVRRQSGLSSKYPPSS